MEDDCKWYTWRHKLACTLVFKSCHLQTKWEFHFYFSHHKWKACNRVYNFAIWIRFYWLTIISKICVYFNFTLLEMFNSHNTVQEWIPVRIMSACEKRTLLENSLYIPPWENMILLCAACPCDCIQPELLRSLLTWPFWTLSENRLGLWIKLAIACNLSLPHLTDSPRFPCL